ncbi:MAG: hypothetical protein NW201_02270 [Gemmatimonadales bacterium]|nr:hypothetical protein [Gemmatimonadales bacterium]
MSRPLPVPALGTLLVLATACTGATATETSLTAAATAAAASAVSTGPVLALAGTWALDTTRSDRPPQGGPGGPGGMGGPGGPGGPPPGGMGAQRGPQGGPPSMGNGQRPQPPGDGARPQGAPGMTITQQGSTLLITRGPRTDTLVVDGTPRTRQRPDRSGVTVTATWGSDGLVIVRRDDRATMTETWSLLDGGAALRQVLALPALDGRDARTMTVVFTKG